MDRVYTVVAHSTLQLQKKNLSFQDEQITLVLS